MCQHSATPTPPAPQTPTPACAKPAPASQTGSRRRRLWELEPRLHCPVVGVCLPMLVLRRVVEKTFRGSGRNIDSDYNLHSGAVGECKNRTRLAESMQRELELRYRISVHQASQLKTTETLAGWWRDSSPKDLAGALWATVTHARCSTELAQQVYGEVHMLQHQVGAAQRADHQHLDALLAENAVLARELARAQDRSTTLASEHCKSMAQQQGQVLQLRAQVITRNTRLESLQTQLNTLQAAMPDLACRVRQAQELALQADRIHALERALLQAQQGHERRGRLMDAQASEPEVPSHTAPDTPAHLDDRAVLCVGGRTASVPLYRHIIEGSGGRFTHHDGGDEESLTKLDTTLAAADLVICQTGCISHNAYWRVKDHCKRTGKPCLFVENTGTASLKRALSALPVALKVV